jgi:hypothetical protein
VQYLSKCYLRILVVGGCADYARCIRTSTSKEVPQWMSFPPTPLAVIAQTMGHQVGMTARSADAPSVRVRRRSKQNASEHSLAFLFWLQTRWAGSGRAQPLNLGNQRLDIGLGVRNEYEIGGIPRLNHPAPYTQVDTPRIAWIFRNIIVIISCFQHRI